MDIVDFFKFDLNYKRNIWAWD